MTVGTVLIAMAIGVGLAPLLDRKFLGRGTVRTLLITPFLVMPVAGALVWKTVMLASHGWPGCKVSPRTSWRRPARTAPGR